VEPSTTRIDTASDLRKRLFFSLVADPLRDMELELLDARSIRFLADHPWRPGKRLRPITFLLSHLSVRIARTPEMNVGMREVRLASAIELLHEASLVHDDLVDGSTSRRGAPTVQITNGAALALLIGDYMLFRGLKLALDAARTRDDLLLAQELANTGLDLALGEIDQLYAYLHPEPGEGRMSLAHYTDIIAKKTALFFAACAEGGAALGGAPLELRRIYRSFGLELGLVFQMVDDLVDIMGDDERAGKSLRNNLAEGTVTLPMLHAHELGCEHPALRKIAACEPVEPHEEVGLYELLTAAPVLERCRETLDQRAGAAAAQIAAMPPSIYRLALADLLEYVRQCPWGGLESRV